MLSCSSTFLCCSYTVLVCAYVKLIQIPSSVKYLVVGFQLLANTAKAGLHIIIAVVCYRLD